MQCKNSSKNLNESHTGSVLDGGLEEQELGRDRVGTGQLHPKRLGEFLPQPPALSRGCYEGPGASLVLAAKGSRTPLEQNPQTTPTVVLLQKIEIVL